MSDAKPPRCRFELLAEVVALLDRDVDLSEVAEPCDQDAAFSTFIARKRPGQDVEIYTLTCEGHDQQAHVRPGYVRSIGLGRPKPDPAI